MRRRGWFWHWNGIITQYTPLIGLKGVGLLNSYTAWTDRREHSPHRGYAFPSQRAEAAFYGEDRAELITINKILVTLDLIEIRKEMVTKTDEQGRNWRVPHNFYRVKDRVEGLDLTAADVLRVVELAEQDAGVYRYIRKIFSSRFHPIDRDNVWHRILEEIAEHPTWQKLQARARKQEERASARTRAGHKSRKAAQPSTPNGAPTSADAETLRETEQEAHGALLTSGQNNALVFKDDEQTATSIDGPQTSADSTNRGSATTNDQHNHGWTLVAELPNHGSTEKGETIAEPSNSAQTSTVDSSNPTYNQEVTTTTTTTTRAPEQEGLETGDEASPAGIPAGGAGATPGESAGGAESESDRAGEGPPGRGPDDSNGWGPLDDPSALVVSLFEAANDRRATSLERVLLSELERDAAVAAEAIGSTGTEWVAAALREAVESGSAFVAPRRIREIINRWTAEDDGPRVHEPELSPESTEPRAPHESRWQLICQALQRALDKSVYDDIVASSVALRIEDGRLIVGVRDPAALEKLTTTYRSLVERTAARVAGSDASVHFVQLDSDVQDETFEPLAPDSTAGEAEREISAADAERGAQLWQAILDEIEGVIPDRDWGRLSNVLPLGQDPDGALVLGVSSRLARELVEVRYRGAITRSLSRLFGTEVVLRVAGPGSWRVRGR